MNEINMSEFTDKIKHAESEIQKILTDLQKDVDCRIRRVELIEGQQFCRKNAVVMGVILEVIY